MKTTKAHQQQVQWKQKMMITGNLIAQNFRTHNNGNLSSYKNPLKWTNQRKKYTFMLELLAIWKSNHQQYGFILFKHEYNCWQTNRWNRESQNDLLNWKQML